MSLASSILNVTYYFAIPRFYSMPHKKAKLSVREQQRKEQGSNHAPQRESIANEAIPKSAARVLNALKIREEYKTKRKLDHQGSDDSNVHKRRRMNDFPLRIKSGESIQHFYRRVEDDMRPLVRSAVQTSKAVERKARHIGLEAKKKRKEAQDGQSRMSKSNKDSLPCEQSPSAPPSNARQIDRPKEFQTISTSTPRRLNDVAQAPPDIKGTARSATTGEKWEGVFSMAQKSMMDAEREKVIARYRMLKASRSRTVKKDEP